MTTNPLTLLRRFADAYDALQATDGAGTFLDESRTFTAGHWLGQRMAGLAEEARTCLAEYDRLTEGRRAKLAVIDEAGSLVGESAIEAMPITLVCAICGNKQTGDLFAMADEGWIPEFWTSKETGDGPACPGCVKHRIDVDGESGEFVLKPKSEWTR